MRSTLVTALLVGVLLVGSSPGALAEATPPVVSGSTTSTGVPTNDIIPEPNQGSAPREAGDRGGAAQIGVLVGIVVALATIVVLVRREAHRARARRSSAE